MQGAVTSLNPWEVRSCGGSDNQASPKLEPTRDCGASAAEILPQRHVVEAALLLQEQQGKAVHDNRMRLKKRLLTNADPPG